MPKTVHTIIGVNRTSKSGDGKIFVMPVMDAVRVLPESPATWFWMKREPDLSAKSR